MKYKETRMIDGFRLKQEINACGLCDLLTEKELDAFINDVKENYNVDTNYLVEVSNKILDRTSKSVGFDLGMTFYIVGRCVWSLLTYDE